MTVSAPMPLETAPLQVLVVCPRGEYLDTVRGLVGHWVRSTQIYWTMDPVAALQRARHSPPALTILDARIDRASGCMLSRELALAHTDFDVLSFDDPGRNGARSQPSTWHWCELPRAIGWWVQRHLVPAAPTH